MKNIPYVYFLKNLSTGLKYIGVRYSNNCTPEDFWKTYFTSSKLVKSLIEVYGENDFEYKILKIFDTEFLALEYERNLLKLAVLRDDYLNLHINFQFSNEEEYLLHKQKMFKVHSLQGKLQYATKTGFHGVSKEQFSENARLGGFAAAKINKELERAIFDPVVRKQQHKTLKNKQVSAFYDPILKKEISSKGGKNSCFSSYYFEKIGLTEEDRIKAQSERGKKGGPKNKGFIWYNDGISSFKYTSKEQLIKSFDKFIYENKLIFFKGRLNTYSKNKIWVNDGTKNFMIEKTELTNKLILGKIKNIK